MKNLVPSRERQREIIYQPGMRWPLAALRFARHSRPAATIVADAARLAIRSRELTNYTYDLTDRNRRHLAHVISLVTGVEPARVHGYFAELEANRELAEHVAAATATAEERMLSDVDLKFGSRIGWYALARILRPSLVIEAGIDKGLGSCVLAAALLANEEEGHGGRYLGIELKPHKGWLLSGRYAEVGEVRYGDALEVLDSIEGPIDIYISATAAGAELERGEWARVTAKLAADGLCVAQMAHSTDELSEAASARCWPFVPFTEQPVGHAAGAIFGFSRPALGAGP